MHFEESLNENIINVGFNRLTNFQTRLAECGDHIHIIEMVPISITTNTKFEYQVWNSNFNFNFSRLLMTYHFYTILILKDSSIKKETTVLLS